MESQLTSNPNFSAATVAYSSDDLVGGHSISNDPNELADVRVLIVDDEPINLKVAAKYLRDAGYRQITTVQNATLAYAEVLRQTPDVVLLDLLMPGVSGLEILELIRQDEQFSKLPVIILTAVDNRTTKARALELGATDFLTKPVDPCELLPRLRNTVAGKRYEDRLRTYADDLQRLVDERTAEVIASRLELIHCLGRAAEYRDNETGHHVIRVGKYVGLIARQLGLSESDVMLLEQAAPLHDVGKIGIPDAVLLKPGKLDPEEFAHMKKHTGFGRHIVSDMNPNDWKAFSKHTALGASIMDACRSPVLKLASTIALTHHEKWDGSGYPLGLSGEDIPLEGRITAVADVFDALSSKRPYKPAYPLDECFRIMDEGREKHFDPRVFDAFVAQRANIIRVQIELADVD